MPGRDIAIIGGGWAGIAAAIELTEAGERVSLIEAAPSLGGRAREIDGKEPLDNGQHILSGAYCETLALMERIGLSPARLMRRLPFTFMNQAGMRLALPEFAAGGFPGAETLGMAWGLFAARGISWRAKWQAARWMRVLKRQKFELQEDCEVSRWLAASGQSHGFCRDFWEPLCLAALNTPARKASARLFARVLRDTLGNDEKGSGDLLLPTENLSGLLPTPAARWLVRRGASVRLGCRVKWLRPSENGWKIGSAAGQETFTRVILAVAPQHLPALLRELPPAMTDEATPFPLPPADFSPIATLYFHYPETVRLPFPLMALTGGIGQWLVDRGNGLIAAVLSGMSGWEQLSRETLARRLHPEIGQIIGARPLPAFSFFIEKRATFAALPNFVRCPQRTPWQGLFLAGDHCWADYPATLEGAVRSGREAARLCLQSG
ncbi:MAG: hydroxysqualene dehydroxylase HpnE [Zoogloeaceae bacterium]|jgi:squalene-associated FAD-dependent desaturase|nr:hydroxysqualene dehydroxylase HpnE [Zoogloeaceae bacterium]